MKIKSMLPRSPKNGIVYLSDYFTAFLPSIIFAILFYSPSVIGKILLAVAGAFVPELILSFFLKKELDITLAVRVLILCLCVPSYLPKLMFFIGGVLVFMCSSLRGFTDKYLTFEVVTLSVVMLLIFTRVKTPSSLVLKGIELNDISVLDLILGTKSDFFMGGCLICILFAFIFLSIRKRVSFLAGVMFYASLICVLGFLYTKGEPDALYFVSFVALDPKIFFASLILTTIGGTLPSSKKALFIGAIIAGAASGAAMIYTGISNSIYYVIIIMSLLSRPIEILICKAGQRKA